MLSWVEYADERSGQMSWYCVYFRTDLALGKVRAARISYTHSTVSYHIRKIYFFHFLDYWCSVLDDTDKRGKRLYEQAPVYSHFIHSLSSSLLNSEEVARSVFI